MDPTSATPGPPERPAPAGTRVFVIALLLIAAAGLWLTGRYALAMSIPFADTHTYLDVGRNWADGRGFVTRFNVVYGWSDGISHPGLAYYNPLYGLLLGVFWRIAGHTGALALVATALPAVLNAVLLAVLVRPSMGRLVALLSAAGYLIAPATCLLYTSPSPRD